jgi:hypothetical protein
MTRTSESGHWRAPPDPWAPLSPAPGGAMRVSHPLAARCGKLEYITAVSPGTRRMITFDATVATAQVGCIGRRVTSCVSAVRELLLDRAEWAALKTICAG